MSKFIVADQKIRILCDDQNGSYEFQTVEVGEFLTRLSDGELEITELITCKDCKHREKRGEGFVCTAFYGFQPWVGDNFFCGNGEAKE